MNDSGAASIRPVDIERAARAVGVLVPDPSPELVTAVLERLDWVQLDAGQSLFEYGDESDSAYFVLRGRLRVTVPGDDGGERLIRDLGKGAFVGEMGLISRQPRSATIRAVRETALGRLSAEAFQELASEFPEALMGIATMMVRRVGSGPSRADVGSVVLFEPHRYGDDLAGRLTTAMAAHGPVEHLSRQRLESVLEAPGIADASIASDDGGRVTRLLARLEDDTGRLLLEADASVTPWTERALRSADLVVVILDAEPLDDDHLAVEHLRASLAAMPHVETWLVVRHPAGTDRPRGTELLASRHSIETVIHLRSDVDADLHRLARLVSGNGVGLVLGGGGARGLAHVGVFRAMVELGIPVDSVGGSSIGAILGGFIAQGHDPDAVLAIASRRLRRPVDYTLPLVALAKGRRGSRQIAGAFAGWTFEDLWTPFFCMSTNLTHTEAVAHHSGDLIPALRASFSIPGMFPPTPIAGDLHVDAGVLDNLPVGVMRSRPGVGTVIAVDVAPPRGPRARADYGLSVSGWRALGRRRKYPRISAVMMRSMILGSMQQRDQLVASGAVDLYLDLDLRGTSLLDFKQSAAVADAGYEAAMPRLEAWLEDG